MAAKAAPRARDVAIIGYGRFGRALAELCLEHDLSVVAYDPSATVPAALAAPSASAAVAGARVVVVAVPVARMRAALEELAPQVGAAELVLDVGSVKSIPIAAMEELLGDKVAWIGTHPLFGPTSLALGERPLRVVLCPNQRHPAALGLARRWFTSLGCEIIEQSADAHDRAMADTHALAFFVAKGLLDAKAGEGVAFAPPSFQAIARTIDAVRSDAGHLFRAIQHENPYAGAARRRLLDALHNVEDQLRAEVTPRSTGAEAGPSDTVASGLGPPDPLAIPDLGTESPDLRQTRELIDAVDRELIELLTRRAALSLRARRAKAELGLGVLDPERERSVLEERARLAERLGLDGEAVKDVFEAIMRLSRSVQRR